MCKSLIFVEVSLVILFVDEFTASSDKSSSSGGNETAFLTSGSVSSGSSWVTNVLMVTTTVRMFDGVHSNTSHSGPVLPLCLGLEVGGVGLKEGLVASLASSGHSDHGSAAAKNGLSDAGWESNTRFLSILRMSDDNARGSGGTGNSSAVSEFGLNAGDNSTFGHLVDGQDIADLEGSFLTGVDELAGVHA